MLLGNYPIEQQSQDGNRQQSKPKRPSFHMAKTWNLTLRYPCSSLFPTKQQLRRIFAFKRVLFWPSWSSAKKESRLLCIHWVFFAAWLLNYWSGRQSGPIPWTWCQKGDKYRWNQMDSNGSIVFNITQLIMGNPTAAHMCCFHALIVDWAFEPDRVEWIFVCCGMRTLFWVHCHTLP